MTWASIIAFIVALPFYRILKRGALLGVRFVGIPTAISLGSLFWSILSLSRLLMVPLAVFLIANPEYAKGNFGQFSTVLIVVVLIGASVSMLYSLTAGLRSALSFGFVAMLALLVFMKFEDQFKGFQIGQTLAAVQAQLKSSAPVVPIAERTTEKKRDDLVYSSFSQLTPRKQQKRVPSQWNQGALVNVDAVSSQVNSFLSNDWTTNLFGSSQDFTGVSDDMFFPKRGGKRSYYGFALQDSKESTFSLLPSLSSLLQ